jgi:hypothetical protein
MPALLLVSLSLYSISCSAWSSFFGTCSDTAAVAVPCTSAHCVRALRYVTLQHDQSISKHAAAIVIVFRLLCSNRTELHYPSHIASTSHYCTSTAEPSALNCDQTGNSLYYNKSYNIHTKDKCICEVSNGHITNY